MIDAVAPGRLRSVWAVAVVVGLMVSLFSLCCCAAVDLPVPAGVGDTVGAASVHVVQGGATDAARDVDQDCDQLATPDAAVPVSAHGVLAVASRGVGADLEAVPGAGPPPGARSRPPVPHLLCVMRT